MTMTKTELLAAIHALQSRGHTDLIDERLGDMVHDAKSVEASRLNNDGVHSQVDYLVAEDGGDAKATFELLIGEDEALSEAWQDIVRKMPATQPRRYRVTVEVEVTDLIRLHQAAIEAALEGGYLDDLPVSRTKPAKLLEHLLDIYDLPKPPVEAGYEIVQVEVDHHQPGGGSFDTLDVSTEHLTEASRCWLDKRSGL